MHTFHPFTLATILAPLYQVPGSDPRPPCKAPERGPAPSAAQGGQGDCDFAANIPDPAYGAAEVRELPVVFHVIRHSDGTGDLPPAIVQEQLAILNEDFRALPGTKGADGSDVRVRFALASVDPTGQPTSGITYSTNDAWFADSGAYWISLGWDTARYVNVYTNSGGGALGYVPALPQAGVVGQPEDRIVLAWDAVGRNAPIGPPYDLGTVLTHEMGHYLGLWHTFQGGCDMPTGCQMSGDLICDTAPELFPLLGGCVADGSCGVPSSFTNYMSYSAHACQTEFTEEQVRRMRCTLQHWRPMVWSLADIGSSYCPALPNSAGPGTQLRADGSAVTAANGVALLVDSAPATKPGISFVGTAAANLPFGDGRLCVGGGIQRIPPPQPTDAYGRARIWLDLAVPPLAGLVAPGGTTYFQYWHRDPPGGPAGFNLSNGLALTWQ